MAKTAKVKPTADTGAKTKKSTSRKTVRGKRNNTNELPSSPLRSRADRAAHRGALLNPTDVDDPALSAVNPSVSDINYDVVSPQYPRAARAQANNAIGDNNFWEKTVDKGIDLAYDSDSDDEDYRGDVYDDDYSDGEESLAKYRVPLARAMVLAVSLRLDGPLNQTQQGCLNGMLWLRSLIGKKMEEGQ